MAENAILPPFRSPSQRAIIARRAEAARADRGACGAATEATLELTADEVRRIARLARVALTDDEVERFRTELGGILAHC